MPYGAGRRRRDFDRQAARYAAAGDAHDYDVITDQPSR